MRLAAVLDGDVAHRSSQLAGDRALLASINPAELAERLHAGDVIVLDVRPEPEFRATSSARLVIRFTTSVLFRS